MAESGAIAGAWTTPATDRVLHEMQERSPSTVGAERGAGVG